MNSTTLAVPDHRIRVYGQEEGPCVNLGINGVQHIGLTPDSNPPEGALHQNGSQYIYQYAHELGHVLSNHEEANGRRFKWFEETLSELASLHTLRADGRQGYASVQIGRLAAKRAEISDFDATGRVSDWYPYAIVRLGQNPTIRELNGAIACELLPYFESDERLWESVTHINKWNGRSDDFRSYLDSWSATLVRQGLGSRAPEVVRAVLYAEGDVSEPPDFCNRIGGSNPTGGESAGGSMDGNPEGVMTGSGGIGSNPQEALHESMGDFDREMARERSAMASVGQGMSRSTENAAGGPVIGDVPMVVIPNSPNQAPGTPSAGAKKDESVPSEKPKIEIPGDIAESADGEDPVARQIREAAEQEENPRLREALWEEYRKHAGLK